MTIDATAGLWDLVEQRATLGGSAEMLVDERGRRLTFAQFRDHAELVAGELAARGAGPGTPVTWQLPTVIEALVVTGALARLGAIQNPVMPICGERDLRFILAQTGAKLFITTKAASDRVRQAEKLGTGGLDALVVGAGLIDPEPPSDRTETDPDVRWVFYSSGTTAAPKGARHTDASILAAARGTGGRLACTEDDRVGLAFPIAHIGGCGAWLGACLIFGSGLVLDSAFQPERTSGYFARENVTLAGSGAVFIQAYLDLQRRQPERPILPRLRAMTAGGSPRPSSLHHDVVRTFAVGVLSGYGMTEAPVITMAGTTDPDDALAATEGLPNSGVDLRVIGGDGRPVAPGREGEFHVKAPQLMRGYVDAALDADAFDEDGYFRTGDLGRIDENGYVIVTGRLKDVIIRKGENISARALEDALADHPAVADVTVVGLPDDERGELACAVVVPGDDGPPTLPDLTGFLADRGMSSRQWPERLEIVDTLPRNATGKVLKTELRKRYAERGH